MTLSAIMKCLADLGLWKKICRQNGTYGGTGMGERGRIKSNVTFSGLSQSIVGREKDVRCVYDASDPSYVVVSFLLGRVI